MNTPSPKRASRQPGFTLVEMMVALVVGMLVLFGVGQIFFKTKHAAILQEELARMQENSRYALQLLGSEIRNAGYLGCRHASNIDAAYIDTSGSYSDNFALAVEGYEAAGTAPGDSFTLGSSTASWSGGNATEPNLTATPLGSQPLTPGSDIIVVRYAHGAGLELAREKQNDSDVIVTNTTTESNGCNGGGVRYSGLCPGDQVLISDCERVRSFTIGTLALNSGELTVTDSSGAHWVGEHNSTIPFTIADSSLYEGRTIAFFIRNDNATPPQPALYRKIGNGAAQELVTGVENMQIVYGEDTDGDGVPNQYLSADRVGDFTNVVSARIGLVLRTSRESARHSGKTKHLSVLSTTITIPGDRFPRRVFTSTIQLRNPRE